MAELYLAHQRGAAGFSKVVALKRILPHLAEDPTFTRMFLDEARLASGLDHPHLAHVLDFGEHEGEHFLTMEYVHGRNLHEILRAQGERELPVATVLTIVACVARGLHDLHEQRAPDGRPLGLVHRDVSPSNVLVSYDGIVKLTDFGIAKAMELTAFTRTGTFKGKLGHASPEQVRGEAIDRRSDVFCLGILLYEATTGMRAFSGPNEFAVMGKVARGQYAPVLAVMPHCPPPLASIVDRALSTDPAARYPTAAAFADALEEFAYQADVRLGAHPVAATMEASFGPAPPVMDGEERGLTTQLDPRLVTGSQGPPRHRRSSALLVAVPVALLAGASGAWALRPMVEPSEATPQASVAPRLPVVSPVQPAPAPPLAAPPPPLVVPPPLVAPPPIADATPSTDPEHAETPGPPNTERKRRKATARNPKKKRATPASAPDPNPRKAPEGLYPPE